MSALGAAGEGAGEGVKKGAKWWIIGLLATVAIASVFTGGIAGVVFGLALGAHAGLIAGIVGAVAGLIGGGVFATHAGAAAGATVAGAGLVVGGAKGISNHIKRGQNTLDKEQQSLIDDNARLSAAIQEKEAQMTKNLADQYGTMGNPYVAKGHAERELERRQQNISSLSVPGAQNSR